MSATTRADGSGRLRVTPTFEQSSILIATPGPHSSRMLLPGNDQTAAAPPHNIVMEGVSNGQLPIWPTPARDTGNVYLSAIAIARRSLAPSAHREGQVRFTPRRQRPPADASMTVLDRRRTPANRPASTRCRRVGMIGTVLRTRTAYFPGRS